MATDWLEAQANERFFWEGVYSGNEEYSPFSDTESLNFLFMQLKRFNIAWSSFKSVGVLLDVGCGPTGIHEGICLLNSKTRVIANDPLADLYSNLNQKTYPNREWLSCMGEELLNANLGKVDFVHCSNVIDHVRDPFEVLKSFVDISNDDTIIALNVHVLRGYFWFLGGVLKYVDKNHPHHLTRGRFEDLCLKSGLKVKLTYKASLLEDNPTFTLMSFISNFNFRSFKRMMSNLLLETVYYRCTKV